MCVGACYVGVTRVVVGLLTPGSDLSRMKVTARGVIWPCTKRVDTTSLKGDALCLNYS